MHAALDRYHRPEQTLVVSGYNDDERYPEPDRIRAAVRELCPARTCFGYE